MKSCNNTSLHLFWLLLLIFNATAQNAANQRPFNNNVSAILVFGDSTVDSGNNNYVDTLFKGNFLPYGKDFQGQTPTGRFSNGRLTTDFIASYAGIKDAVPPYLDPNLSISELLTGVSFASAGSGFDPLTPQMSSVISISRQVNYFREYKKKLELTIGKKRTEDHITRAVIFIGAGTNDFVINYFTLPVRRRSYSISNYQQFILQHVETLIQDLWSEGARRFGVSGLPPMGCLPVVITLYSDDPLLHRDCIDKYSQVGMEHNMKLQQQLNSMHNNLANQGARIHYIDIFNPLVDAIQGFGKLGFDEVSNGCCGTGYLEMGYLCNPNSHTCPDASKYVFFDSIHPSEKIYYKVFDAARDVVNSLIRD